MDVIIYK